MENNFSKVSDENINVTTSNWLDANITLPQSTADTPMLKWSTTKQAEQKTQVVFHVVFLIIGLVGNSTIVLLMMKKKLLSKVARIILVALAVSDTGMIITHTFNQQFMKKSLGMDIRALSTLGCKLFFIIYRTSKMTSAWFTVFLCLERFIAITWPLEMKRIITEQRAKIYVAINFLASFCFNFTLSFSTTIYNGNVCIKTDPSIFGRSVLRVLTFIEILLFSIVPILINIVFTPVTIVNLYKYYKKRQQLCGQSNQDKTRLQTQLHDLVRTSVILITVMITFVVSVTPITVYQLIKFWENSSKELMEKSQGMNLLKVLVLHLEQINYSINFLLYMLTSSKFRQYLIAYITNCCKCEFKKLPSSTSA